MLGRFGFERRDDTLVARLKRQQTGLPIEARIFAVARPDTPIRTVRWRTFASRSNLAEGFS
jgi:hypothetical protein